MKTDQKIKEQENRIKELEAELEKLQFRSHLSLQVPEAEAPVPPQTPRRSNKAETPAPDTAADLYELGKKCMAANADLISEKTTVVNDLKPEMGQTEDEGIEAANSWTSYEEDIVEFIEPEATEGVSTEAQEVTEPEKVGLQEEEAQEVTGPEKVGLQEEETQEVTEPEKAGLQEEVMQQSLDAEIDQSRFEVAHQPSQSQSESEPEVLEEMSVGSLPEVEDKISHSQDENEEPVQEEPVQDYPPQEEQPDKKLSEAGSGEVNTLLDDIFAEAQLEFGSDLKPHLQERTQSSSDETPREQKTNVHGSKESREEDAHDASTISTDTEKAGEYLEISREELAALKTALNSGKTAHKKESLSEMFEKEMQHFQSEIAGLDKTAKTPPSTRDHSEVSSGSAGSGSVKRLASLFLSKSQKSCPSVDVNAPPSSPEGLTKLSTPQAGFRRSALEGDGQE
jgi:hypothetical protein